MQRSHASFASAFVLGLAIVTLLYEGAQADPNFIVPGGRTTYESEEDPPYSIDWPTVNWSRGGNNATYAEWDTFGWVDPPPQPPIPGDIEPDVGYAGFPEATDAVVNELTGFAFYTSSKNLYSFSVATEFEATLPAPAGSSGSDAYFVAQINTIASEVDYSSVLLSYDGGEQQLGASGSMETKRGVASGGGFEGSEVSTLFWWALPGVSPSGYILEFKASGSSMSLANLALDAFSAGAPPTPGDYDGSGAVDQQDYNTWRMQYGSTVDPFTGADGNGDGRVDAGDYALWRGAMTQDTRAASLVAVPEPGALGWCGLFGATVLFCWGSHRSIAPRN